MFDELKIILEKDPIISTYNAGDIIKSPKSVEKYYGSIAKTHMSLGDTNQYQQRIYDCLIRNQTTFNGAVVGEYGFGKTSILIYLWDFCETKNILAIPPYQWKQFQEHFNVLYYWIKYKLRKYNQNLQLELENIYKKYKDTSIETRAKGWAQEHEDVSYEQALSIISDEFSKGKMLLEFTTNDLLEYCEELTNLLQRKTDYEGLLVITDELQQTITDLNPKMVYDYLFNITNALCNKKGNYGFLWGFPEKTLADLTRERSDIVDRLNSNKAFINLGNIYDKRFPVHLWDSYCNFFDFNDIKYDVVEENTLIAIGQVCDGERRDLGNGPRSVISAFNAMVEHYQKTKRRYEVIDFVNDCIEGEIVLGGGSRYVRKCIDVLDIDVIGRQFEKAIKIMAGFPSGIPDSAILEYGLRDEIDLLIRDSGGLGNVVSKPIKSYMLRILTKTPDAPTSIIKEEIRTFYSEFSPDHTYKQIAHKVFNKTIINSVFKKQSKGSFENWKVTKSWHEYISGYRCFLEGSFSDKYPLRKVVLFTTSSDDTDSVELLKAQIPNEHFVFNFVLYTQIETPSDFNIKQLDENSFQINLNLSYQEDDLGLNQLNEIVPPENQTPLFFLSLYNKLENANIPNSETPENDFLKSKLIENVIYNLFNEDLLGYVENSRIELNNEGEHLIKDLFVSASQESFKDYKTLMTSKSWEKKINIYKNVLGLDSQKVSLLQKRGKESIKLSENPKENKNEIARLFAQRSTGFESWLRGLDNLLDYRFANRDSHFILKTHPLEQYILEQIETDGRDRNIDGILCKALSFSSDFALNLYKMGYLDPEILAVLGIGHERKYFNFDTNNRLIYKKPEDKQELRENLAAFVDKVRWQLERLVSFADFPNSVEQLEELSEMIPLIENKEQADKCLNKLKEIQSTNKHYCKKSLVNISSVEISSDIKQLEELYGNHGVILDDIKDEVLGKVGWVQHLEKIRINIENEIKTSINLGKAYVNKLNKCLPPNIPENVHVIEIFLDTHMKYNSIKTELQNTYFPQHIVIGSSVNYLKKWKASLKLSGDIESLCAKYENFGFDENYKHDIDLINNKIASNLENNYKSTLENHENYRQMLHELMEKMRRQIADLKGDWENRKKYYEKHIKDFTGSFPSSTIRWSESPELSYLDLHTFVEQQVNTFLEKKNVQVNELADDITYSMEVLNHKKAIRKREMDKRIQELSILITDLQGKDIIEDIKKRELFETYVEHFKSINASYSNLYKEHKSIIKPITIENELERKFFDLLDKNNAIDLKKLILAYQRKCNPDIDLTASRDEVLEFLKELFLKKQIGIFIKKGKM